MSRFTSRGFAASLRIMLLLAACSLIAADRKESGTKIGATKKPMDMERIQGTWLCVAVKYGYAELPKEAFAKWRWTFKGDQFVLDHGAGKSEGRFKLAFAKRRKTIDMKGTGGDWKEKAFGIYLLDGDKLSICMTEKEQRPKEFKTTSEDVVILTLKREKK